MNIRFLIILFTPWLLMQCQSSEQPGQLVVEGSITAGEPVSNISVHLVDGQGPANTKPASNAEVRLLSLGVTYILNEISDKPGHYAYQGDDLEIISGQEYMLWVQHENAVAVISTVIKADTMVHSEIEKDLGYPVARN